MKEETQMSNAELLALLNAQDDEGMGWNNPFFYLIFIWLFACLEEMDLDWRIWWRLWRSTNL